MRFHVPALPVVFNRTVVVLRLPLWLQAEERKRAEAEAKAEAERKALEEKRQREAQQFQVGGVRGLGVEVFVLRPPVTAGAVPRLVAGAQREKPQRQQGRPPEGRQTMWLHRGAPSRVAARWCANPHSPRAPAPALQSMAAAAAAEKDPDILRGGGHESAANLEDLGLQVCVWKKGGGGGGLRRLPACSQGP